MYETIRRLFVNGRLSKEGVEAAVTRGWISQEQATALLQPEDVAVENSTEGT